FRLFSPCPLRPPPGRALFPYTTLFRSRDGRACSAARGGCRFRRSPPERGCPRGSAEAGPRGERRQWRAARGPGSPVRRQRCRTRSEEHTSELQSRENLVCRLLLEKKKS